MSVRPQALRSSQGKLKHNIASTKELEDQLSEQEREIKAFRFEVEQLRVIRESHCRGRIYISVARYFFVRRE